MRRKRDSIDICAGCLGESEHGEKEVHNEQVECRLHHKDCKKGFDAVGVKIEVKNNLYGSKEKAR